MDWRGRPRHQCELTLYMPGGCIVAGERCYCVVWLTRGMGKDRRVWRGRGGVVGGGGGVMVIVVVKSACEVLYGSMSSSRS